jgi:hypothetical protein
MNRNFLQLGQSEWWVLVIILISIAFSYFLYSKKEVPWNPIQNRILGTLRFLSVFMLLCLFLEPSIKKVVNETERPVVVFAIDNSQSTVASTTDSIALKNEIGKIKADLLSNDINYETYLLNKTDSIHFNQKTSNLSAMLRRADEELQGKNIAATILFSDGIFNRGSSPNYLSYLAPVFTVGLGDTIPPRDMKISRVLYNKVTYKGNETPIQVEVSQKGYDNKLVNVILTEKGKVIDRKEVRLTSSVQEIAFLLKSEKEGLRHLQVTIPVVEDESIKENNRSDLFMEVIDGKEKVLIVASAPHPDIKAIRSTLESTENYQTVLYIPGIHDEKPSEIFDVVIFHGAFTSGVNFQVKENPGIWYILSNESAITSINRTLPFMDIQRKGSQPDKVSGSFNKNFTKFKIDEVSAFEEFPPIEVPFGDYSLSGPTEVLMYQKLGSITTRKPLMAFYDDGTKKSAVLMGQNIWKWKLQESAIDGEADQFKNFITKTVQFLSVKNDKKRFQFKLRNTTFLTSETVVFDSEVYNDIYERIYGNFINLEIISEDGSSKNFNFEDSQFNNSFKIPPLESGVYLYSASVKIGDKTFTDKGEFLIENVNPEYIDLTANHNLLKHVSNKTGGQYIHFSELNTVTDLIKSQNFKSVIRSSETFFPLNQSLLWFLFIFLLFSAEWFLRKYWGGY